MTDPILRYNVLTINVGITLTVSTPNNFQRLFAFAAGNNLALIKYSFAALIPHAVVIRLEAEEFLHLA